MREVISRNFHFRDMTQTVFFLQGEPNNPPSSKDVFAAAHFLMDGAKLNNDPFTLKVVEGPVIMSNARGMVSFPTEFPCKEDSIVIQVKYLYELS